MSTKKREDVVTFQKILQEEYNVDEGDSPVLLAESQPNYVLFLKGPLEFPNPPYKLEWFDAIGKKWMGKVKFTMPQKVIATSGTQIKNQ
jgi:hypothetical protein